TALSTAPTSVSAAATLRIDGEGAAGGNVPLLRLYDPSGHRLLSLYRPNGSTVVYAGWSGTFVPTAARLPTGTFRRFQVEVTTGGDGASTLVVSVDGIEVYRTPSASLGSPAWARCSSATTPRRSRSAWSPTTSRCGSARARPLPVRRKTWVFFWPTAGSD